MSMSAFLQKCRASAYCGVLSIRKSFKLIHTYKMADKPIDHTTKNGFESKTPFLIGVAGGTASGKDIWSSLSVPSGLGCATLIYPDSAALMAAQIIGIQDYLVWARLRVKQLDMAAALRQADKKIRNQV